MGETRKKKLYIWGTGADAECLLQKYHWLIDYCEGFIDSDESKQGQRFHKRLVYSPYSVVLCDEEVYIVIATSKFFREIEGYLKEQFFYNYVGVSEGSLLLSFFSDITENCCKKSEMLYSSKINEILDTFPLTCVGNLLYEKGESVALVYNKAEENYVKQISRNYNIVDVTETNKIIVCTENWEEDIIYWKKQGYCVLPYWFWAIAYIGGVDLEKMKQVSNVLGISVSSMLKHVKGCCDQKEMLLLYGNCQIWTCESLLITSKEFLDRYIIVKTLFVHQMKQQKENIPREFFGYVDLFIYQNVSGVDYPQELHTDTIVGWLREGVRKVCIPNAYFLGYYPQVCSDEYNREYAEFGGVKVFSMGDKNIREMTDKGMSAEEIADTLMNEDFYTKEEVEKNVVSSINELKERERLCDIKISDFIMEWYTKKKLFYIQNHPSCFLINELLQRVFLYLGETYTFKVDQGEESDYREIFIYPSVAKALSLPFAKEKYCYFRQVDPNPSDMLQYVQAYQKYCSKKKEEKNVQ